MPQHRSNSDVHLDFALRPHGWASAVVEIREVEVTVLASYMSDALGDLLRAALALAGGASEQKVVWVEEPGCNEWVLSRNLDTLRVQIDHYEGLYPAHLGDRGVSRFDAKCPAAQFYRAVYTSASAALSTHGPDGYKKLWRSHDFPTTELDALGIYVASDND